jgi:hypothetical protein
MSANSNFDSPLKKGERKNGLTIEEITTPTPIAVGRGYEDQVATKSAALESEPAAMAMVIVEESPTMEKLAQIIDESPLPPKAKSEAHETLSNGLVKELEKGEQANSLIIKKQLDQITAVFPDIRSSLRLFIENYVGVSKTIKILTHKLLD